MYRCTQIIYKMKRVIDLPTRGFETKDARVAESEAGNNADNVNPVLEITTLIKPYQNRDWIHRILPGSLMFSASPERTARGINQMKDVHEAHYMLDLVQLNLVLHQTSLTKTVFQNTPTAKEARYPNMDDILSIWHYRGVLVTPTSENSNQATGYNGMMIRGDKKNQERYVVTWREGEFMTFNYWGNVKNNTRLFLVLKKVPIQSATHFVLFRDQMFIESNEQRTDRLLQPNVNKTVGKMVWQWVPCYPGMPTEKYPKGNNSNPNNLSPDELEFYDLDEPLYDFSLPAGTPAPAYVPPAPGQPYPPLPLPAPPANFPENKNGARKMGHAICVGVCFLNNGYRSGSVYNESSQFWQRDAVFISQQPKIHFYGWSQ